MFDNQRATPQINELETFKNDLLDCMFLSCHVRVTK